MSETSASNDNEKTSVVVSFLFYFQLDMTVLRSHNELIHHFSLLPSWSQRSRGQVLQTPGCLCRHVELVRKDVRDVGVDDLSPLSLPVVPRRLMVVVSGRSLGCLKRVRWPH